MRRMAANTIRLVYDASLRTRRRPMQYAERRHSRLETFKLDNVYITFFIGVHLRIIYSVIHARQLRLQSNRFSSLTYYFGFWLWRWLYLYFHFVSSSQASDNMSSLFSIFSSPQNRHNIQYPNKRWLAKIYIWALWTGKNKCRTAVNYSQWPKRTRILASNFLVRIHSSIQRQLLCNILYYTTKATRILRNLKRSSQLGRAPILAFIIYYQRRCLWIN